MRRPLRVFRISNYLSREHLPPRKAVRQWMKRLTYRLVAGDAARIVLVSPRLQDDPLLATAPRAGKLTVIAKGVDVARVRALAEAQVTHPLLGQEVPVVVSVRRLAPQKNLSTLIEAVAPANRTRSIRLLMIGAGPHEHASCCRRKPNSSASPTGSACWRRCPTLFGSCAGLRFSPLPSLYEGSPNTLFEAPACGTAVVASCTAGNAATILEGGRWGVLVDPRDVAEIAAALLAQADPAQRILPGEIAARYDQRHALDAYEALFKQLADLPAAPTWR